MDRNLIMIDFKKLIEEATTPGSLLSEAYFRDMVGAPTIEESQHCICGEPLDSSHAVCYDHMTNGY